MKKGFYPFLLMQICTLGLAAQLTPFSFTNANAKLTNPVFHSGCALSVVDMDGDGMDDIARLNNGNDLYYEIQRTDTTFKSIHIGQSGSGSAWSMVVGDANKDGVRDVAVGFNGSASLLVPNTNLVGANISTLPSSNFFLQNMNFADIDNDGWADIWGCNDNATSVMWKNTNGVFTVNQFFSPATTPSSDNSGNYGTIWTDFDNDGDIDLYVAHCRQGVNSSSDARRINQLFVNNGNGTYTDDASNTYGLRDGAQTWTSSFEDIDNDGDLDCIITNHDVPSQLFENDGTGHYTDITAGSGYVVNITAYQSKMADFDNDGYVDIMITGSSSTPRIFHNNHDKTFTLLTDPFNGANMQSFAVGDLNHDGRMDIYAGYATGYTSPSNTNDVIWMNTTDNGNHFVTFSLQGTTSNRDALGARVEIYGAWGKQIREVRAGESYGTTNTFMCHFGLGTATMVDSAIVRWPSGLVSTLYNRPADQFINVIEGVCSSVDNIIAFNGPAALCTGQSVTMQATPGQHYLWSTGDTTATLTTSTQGQFTVKVTNADGCSSVSKVVSILQSPDETPTITATGDTKFCEGDSVVLQGPVANAYIWSNGDTTQTIAATQPGSYTLTIQGACAQWTSAPISVVAIPSHVVGTNVSVCQGTDATLQVNATGAAYWYDDATAGNEVTTGSSYQVTAPAADVTYYVESHDTLLGVSGSVGPVNNSFGTGGLFNGDQYQIFDVLKPIVLKQVTVYPGSTKDRTIELRDGSGTVLKTLTINLASGTDTVNLNWTINPGVSYQLGWAQGSNPDLYRNNGGAVYPYTLSGMVSVTGNSANANGYWYAYYDWKVEDVPTICTSSRTPVTVTVNPIPSVAFTGFDTVAYYNTHASVTLTGTPAGGTFSGTGVSGNTFDPATAGVGGPYQIIYNYTDSNTCGAADTQYISVLEDIGSGINTLQGISAVKVYPNPSNGQFTLSFNSDVAENLTVTITNNLGQKVLEEKTTTTAGTFTKQINMNQAAQGIYHITISNGKNIAGYKMIVQ